MDVMTQRANIDSAVSGKTVCTIFGEAAKKGGDKPALHWKRDGEWHSLDWKGYPILRFDECPEVTPVVVQRLDQKSSGAGEESMAAGADCFLQKPFSPQLLSEHLRRWKGRVKAEKNPFTQLTAGVIETANAVTRAYTRAVVERVGSALQAAPKLGLSRQTVASYLASPSFS